jgi:exosortase/archaeosortase family protein
VFGVLFAVLVTLGSLSETFVLRAQHDLDRREQMARLGGEAVDRGFADSAATAVLGYQRWIARSVGGLLSGFGLQTEVDDRTVRVRAASVEVAVECTGIQATAIFCAGVLAFPCSWKARGVGLLLGVFGVGVLNFLRILALAWIRGSHTGWFEDVHALLMQGFLIVFVAPMWVIWMLGANRRWAPVEVGSGGAEREPA